MNWVAVFLPYIAVLLGMIFFHSAWMAILLYHVGIVLLLFFRKRSERWKRMWAGIKSPFLFPCLLICALAAPVIYFMWPWLAKSDTILTEWLACYGLTGVAWLLLVPYFSIIHPILEELHWREISSECKRGLCGYDLLFAGYHVLVLFELLRSPWLILVFAVLTISSIFWRWSAERFDGYGLPILTHAVADFAVLVGILLVL